MPIASGNKPQVEQVKRGYEQPASQVLPVLWAIGVGSGVLVQSGRLMTRYSHKRQLRVRLSYCCVATFDGPTKKKSVTAWLNRSKIAITVPTREIIFVVLLEEAHYALSL